MKTAALTFDDGPDPITTPKVLSILKVNNISATFFLIGQKVKNYPEVVKQIIKNGHIIGNHSYSHAWFAGFESEDQIKKDFQKAQEEILKATGLKPKLLRTPHGFSAPWFRKSIKNLGFELIGWDLDAYDWRDSISVEKIISNVEKNIKPGTIILHHDSKNLKIGSQTKIIKALPKIIDNLKVNGYTFTSVPKIKGLRPYF